MILLAFAAAAIEIPPPRTVNDQVIGSAQQFTTAGPARVCMNDVMVTVLPHETVTLAYSGIHSGRLRLNRGTSWIEAAVGDIYIQPREIGDVIQRGVNFYVADASNESTLRYGLFAPDDFHPGYHLQVWIQGPALAGDENDRSILRRIEMRSDKSPPCDVAYHFGFDVLLGQQPLAERHKN